MRLEKTELINLLVENNATNRKVKHSNNIIIAMLNNLPNNTMVEVERSRGAFYDRGSMVEVLVKMLINQFDSGACEGSRSNANERDLNALTLTPTTRELLGLPNSLNIEIKFATGFAYATPKSNCAHWTLVVNEKGAYLVRSRELNKNTSNKIVANQPKGVRLDKLSELLGF